jgi:glycerate 2-kinase
MDDHEAKLFLTQCLMVAVDAAHPDHCLEPHLPPAPLKGKIILLAGGKAAGAMMKVACGHYLKHIELQRIEGIAVHHHELVDDLFHMQQISASHPVPNANSQKGAELVLELARSAGPEDLVVVLLSGGASALWSAPVEGVELDDKQEITRQLLRSGADIFEINCVRKHLSRIKGGGLAKAVAPAQLVTLAISDVVGDDPSVIASGPTVGDPTTLEDARNIVAKYEIKASTAIKNALADPQNETLFPQDLFFESTRIDIIANGALSLAAAAGLLKKRGYHVINLGDGLKGEAREVAKHHARLAIKYQQEKQPVALLSGGELTVTIRGKGIGGPSQEYALALAMALDGAASIYGLAADTDGCDGGQGRATDPAGALIYPSTLAKSEAKKLNPATFLADNDSGSFFTQLSDLLITGPTHTNVNDFRLILIDNNHV